MAADFAQASSIGVQTVPAACFSVEQAVSEDDQKASHLSHSVLFLLPCLTLRWNARSELFHLRVVDVHSGKESWGLSWVGGDETAWGSHVACFVNECSAGWDVRVDFLWHFKHLLFRFADSLHCTPEIQALVDLTILGRLLCGHVSTLTLVVVCV